MSLLIASRTAQFPLVAEFSFNFDDTMVDTSGDTLDFGLTNVTNATTVVIIPLPPGAVVTGGAVNCTTIFDSATIAITVGDATTADRYLTAADISDVGTDALVPTGYVHASGENIELVFTVADVCTTGAATVRVEYVVVDRSCEVQIT
jgi:hypothetical protein